jgi:hypothetical protein
VVKVYSTTIIYTSLNRPYCSCRYCVLCRRYTFSRLQTKFYSFPLSTESSKGMYNLPKLTAIIANDRLVNHLTEYGYAPGLFTHATRLITWASNTSATRTLSISSKPSSHSTASPPSGKASSTAASLLLETTPQIPPSTTTLTLHSSRNQRANCVPILATVSSYRILQLACCLRLLPVHPCVHSPGRCWDSRHYAIY